VHALAEEMIRGYIVKEAHNYTIWCTPTIGFPKAAARDLAALLEAARQPPIPKPNNEDVFLFLHYFPTWTSSESDAIYVYRLHFCTLKGSFDGKRLAESILDRRIRQGRCVSTYQVSLMP